MPKKVIDDLGGEDYTQEVKRNTGKSKSDLYWNPKNWTMSMQCQRMEKGKLSGLIMLRWIKIDDK